MIEKLGHTLDIASDGTDAVKLFQTKKYDLILMDIRMPGMSGFEATKKIRELESLEKQIPIIALTADATKSNREKCINSGMNDYLTKPIDFPLLQKTLEKWRID